ncbi:MAG: hypothetical protein A2073_07115 [Deltaproteobacteria bacterium GWC2_42_11]|nr:MAG: hypothetical protein A2073_07115 [Deltaproteobacteria bacterium GWC2_42_11]HBO83748.1 hypothetical protein [Deltaproteobacteria bacterium]
MKRIIRFIAIVLLASPLFIAASCGKKAEETKPAETAAPVAPVEQPAAPAAPVEQPAAPAAPVEQPKK